MKNTSVLFLFGVMLFAACSRVNIEPNIARPGSDKGYCSLSVPPDNGERFFALRPPSHGGPVVGLRVEALTTVQFGARLTWDRYTKRYYQYRIYRSEVSGFTPSPQTYIGVASFEIYNDPGLQSLTTYYYKVTHVDRQGNESTPSDEVPYTTQAPSTLEAVIYPDFDGHLISDPNNFWVMNNGGQPLRLAPSKLTPDQQVAIIAYFKLLFAPFNVKIITTEEAFQAANPYKRARVVYTPTCEWYSTQAGGVALIGSFVSGHDIPALVFDSLLYLNQRYNERAGAHEAAHTLWCRHHYMYMSDDPNSPDYCTIVSPYHPGENNISRIMGNPYNYDQAVFTIGRTGTCLGIQDDNQVIQNTLQ